MSAERQDSVAPAGGGVDQDAPGAGTPRQRSRAAAAGLWMTRRYVLALTMIALLASSAYAAFELMLAQHESTLAVVNISGRQRMLSQRSALFVKSMLHADRAREYRRLAGELDEAVTLLEASHEGLINGSEQMGLPSEMSAAMRHLYFGADFALDPQMRRYIAALRKVRDTPFGALDIHAPEVRHILTIGPGPLLTALDRAVSRYQAEGEEAFEMLHRLELAVLTMTLLTLLLEAFWIFRPMVRQAQAQIAHISRIGEDLRRARDSLEEQVRERTLELHQAKEAAEHANLAKSRFLASAGHDLQQPLEAIGMFTGVLARQVDTPKAKAVIDDLRAAQRSMRTLLNALLEISKLEAGVVQPKPQVTALQPLLTQLGNEIRPFAAEKGLQLRVVPCSAQVVTDPALLERILRNFLSNAVRYTREGTVLLCCRPDVAGVRIEVRDSGPGIADEHLHEIFEEFSQLADPNRDRSQGIGLGLAIAERLARLLGHPLRVRTAPGRGSVFSVTVARAGGRDEEASA